MIKKIFQYFGYTFEKIKKSNNINDIIKLKLKSEPCNILIDIGCNRGDFTADLISEFENYYLFEPNPNLYNELKFKFSNHKNVETFSFGIDIENSIKKFHIINDTGQTLSSIKKPTQLLQKNLKNTEITSIQEISFKRLDDFLLSKNLSINSSIFLKTDTQGNEMQVLNSVGKFISNIKFIKCEFPVKNLYEIDYNFWDILSFMKENDFIPLFFENGLRNNKGSLIEFDVLFEKNN